MFILIHSLCVVFRQESWKSLLQFEWKEIENIHRTIPGEYILLFLHKTVSWRGFFLSKKRFYVCFFCFRNCTKQTNELAFVAGNLWMWIYWFLRMNQWTVLIKLYLSWNGLIRKGENAVNNPFAYLHHHQHLDLFSVHFPPKISSFRLYGGDLLKGQFHLQL